MATTYSSIEYTCSDGLRKMIDKFKLRKETIMEAGRLYLYKQKHVVLVLDGAFEVNGRVSNFWDFKYVNLKTGQLGRGGGDYGYEFKPIPKKYYKLQVNLSNELETFLKKRSK